MKKYIVVLLFSFLMVNSFAAVRSHSLTEEVQLSSGGEKKDKNHKKNKKNLRQKRKHRKVWY